MFLEPTLWILGVGVDVVLTTIGIPLGGIGLVYARRPLPPISDEDAEMWRARLQMFNDKCAYDKDKEDCAVCRQLNDSNPKASMVSTMTKMACTRHLYGGFPTSLRTPMPGRTLGGGPPTRADGFMLARHEHSEDRQKERIDALNMMLPFGLLGPSGIIHTRDAGPYSWCTQGPPAGWDTVTARSIRVSNFARGAPDHCVRKTIHTYRITP
jgi:hypothetical protein